MKIAMFMDSEAFHNFLVNQIEATNLCNIILFRLKQTKEKDRPCHTEYIANTKPKINHSMDELVTAFFFLCLIRIVANAVRFHVRALLSTFISTENIT